MPTAEPLVYDVLIAYASPDQEAVQMVAGWLEEDGLRVRCEEIDAIAPARWHECRVLVLYFTNAVSEAQLAKVETRPASVALCVADDRSQHLSSNFTTVSWTTDSRYHNYCHLLDACQLRGGGVSVTSLIMGHRDQTRDAAFSPDGKLLATASEDSTIRLWDLQTGRCLRVLPDHDGGVQAVAWSPDGTRLMSGSRDQTLRLWNPETGQSIRVLKGHSADVSALALSPGGRHALSGSDNGELFVWNIETGEFRRMAGHFGRVKRIAWSPDSTYALSSAADKTMRLWRVADRRSVGVLEDHSAGAWSVAATQGREQLSAGGDLVPLWDVESKTRVGVLEEFNDSVWHVVWDYGARAGELWSRETGKRLQLLSSRGAQILSLSLDGRRAFSRGALWDVLGGRSIRELPDQEYRHRLAGVTWSPDGRFVLCKSDSTELWDVESGRRLRTISSFAWDVFWNASGSLLLNTSWLNNEVMLEDLESGRRLRSFAGHTGTIGSLAFSPDGRRAVSGSDDQTIRLWDVATGEPLRVLTGHTAGVARLGWSPNGRYVISGAPEHDVRLWDADSGECLRAIEVRNWWAAFPWSPDGCRVLIDREIWDLNQRTQIKELDENASPLQWSPDGRLGLTPSRATVKLWDMDSGQIVGTLEGHTGNVTCVAWSPAGKYALSGSEDTTVRLWDTERRTCLHVMEGNTAKTLSVSWTCDGRRAVAASGNGEIRFWDVAEFV